MDSVIHLWNNWGLQYFAVVLFTEMYKVVLNFDSVNQTQCSVTIQIKALEQYLLVVLFIVLFKITVIVEYVN